MVADRAKQIKTKAMVNEDPTEKLIRELQEENERLKAMLSGSATMEVMKDDDEELSDAGKCTQWRSQWGEVTEGHSVWQCHQVMKDDDEDLSVMPLGTHNEGVGNGGCHLSHFIWQCHHEWQHRMQWKLASNAQSTMKLMKDDDAEDLRGNKVEIETNDMSGGSVISDMKWVGY